MDLDPHRDTERCFTNTKEFVLTVDEETVKFENKYFGWGYTPFTVNLKNQTKESFVWQAKCSSNLLFKITKGGGFIEPNQSVPIDIVHIPGMFMPRKGVVHFLEISYIRVAAKVEDYRTPFVAANPDGRKNFKIVYPSVILEPVYRQGKEPKVRKKKAKEDVNAEAKQKLMQKLDIDEKD
ncbi:unnamed protein product [Caenorhabditis sp. 36 PRJEB53466]|nr:unnamed protein product [Caenorhabditis sp. 36 PRJEB53466]